MPTIKHLNEGTAFEVITVTLSPDEKFICEVGALVCCDSKIHVKTVSGTSSKSGGFFSGLKKVLANESFFALELTNLSEDKNQDVTISPNVIGDVLSIDLSKIPGNKILARKGSYFGHYDRDIPISISTHVPKFKTTLFGTGLLQSISGNGIVFMSAEGFCMEKDLGKGEKFIVDSDNLFIYPDGMEIDIEFKGFKNTLFGKDGLLLSMRGPGKVYVNTHNVHQYISLIARKACSGK